MKLLVQLQAPAGCAGCLLNRGQGGQQVCAFRSREKSVVLAKNQTLDCANRVAAVDATITVLLVTGIRPSGSLATRQLWGGGPWTRMTQWLSAPTASAMRHCHQYISCTADRTSRFSSPYSAGHPEVSAAPVRALIVPTGSTADDYDTPACPWRNA